jgi:enoyl-[acyl-carrier protein] reductase II
VWGDGRRTELTELLEIEHPVMLAGMGGGSYHQLVAAVSEAGGFGCMGASTMNLERMVREMEAVRQLTDKPFGVDLLAALPDSVMAAIDVIIDEGASSFIAGLGIPGPVIERCHSAGVKVIVVCGKVEHAKRSEEAG